MLVMNPSFETIVKLGFRLNVFAKTSEAWKFNLSQVVFGSSVEDPS
jgi:hypothetical protein